MLQASHVGGAEHDSKCFSTTGDEPALGSIETMELIHQRCAGLDVHKKNVVVCVRIASEQGVVLQVETFATDTRDLLRLGEWLFEHQIEHAVMESTGVYWKPVWHVLQSFVELTLANAQEVKNLPGRKSDVKDAQWLAELLAHGLLRRSFVPERAIERVRDLTRTRKQMVGEVTRHAQRIDKQLQGCNIKLKSVLSKTLSKSGRAMLRAMISGEADPKVLADLAMGTARKKRAELERALDGFVDDHHRFLLEQHLDTVEHLEKVIKSIEAKIVEALGPFADEATRLETMPGSSKTAASIIIGEIGTDMSRFPTAAQLVSWAGLCPRLDSSAGKSRSTRIRRGNRFLKTAMVQAAWSAIRAGGYLRARFHRICRRAGRNKALVAVARTMLVAVFHMLERGEDYRDLGETHLQKRDRERSIRSLTRRLEQLGMVVELRPLEAG